MPNTNELRTKISELFIKHSMHTNQALISELTNLIQTVEAEAVKEFDKVFPCIQEEGINHEPQSKS
jgi:hypothetical protein